MNALDVVEAFLQENMIPRDRGMLIFPCPAAYILGLHDRHTWAFAADPAALENADEFLAVICTGAGQVNHWSAWQDESSTIQVCW